MGFRASTPAGNTGYNRTSDWPVAGGVGVRVDGLTAGIGGGVNLKGSVGGPSTSQWHPTVAFMLGFVVVEIVLFGMLSRALNV